MSSIKLVIFIINIFYFLYLTNIHKKIVQLKKGDKRFDISIFPNGRLYDLNGEDINEEESSKV